MKKNLISKTTLFLVALTMIALMVGCSSKSTLEAPTPATSQVAVTATPTSVSTNETSVVEATVTADGAGIANQIVQFTVTPASAGTFNPAFDTTGANGIAATTFTAATSGNAVITADVMGTSLSSFIGLSIGSSGVGSGNGSLNVSVTRNLLLANGQDTSLVTIVVSDDLGQPAPDGTLIKITAGEKFVDNDGSGYWSVNIDSLIFDANNNGQWDPFGLIPSTAQITGGTGQAILNYVSGNQAVTSYIKVTVDDGGITASVDVAIQVTPNAVLSSIFLSSDSVSLSVTQTGGIETSTLRATCYDIHGNLLPEGVPIVFAILDGPGGGEHLDTLGYGPDTVLTNSIGIASTQIHSGTVSGTVRIRAYSGATLSNATQILIAAGPPFSIVVGSEHCNVPFWDDVADSVKIVAIVADVYNNPVNDSTVVYFTTDEGVIKTQNERTRFGNGIAVTWWFAGDNDPTADGIVQISAETAGGTVNTSGFFYNTHSPATLAVPVWSSTLNADGEDKFLALITARDLNNNYVISGTQFKADAGMLTVTGGSFEDGCVSSFDRVNVLSTTLKVDKSVTGANDDGIGAIDNVIYWSGLASITMPCTLLTANAYSGTSSITGPSTAVAGEQVRLSVTITDRYTNPLADHTLNMTASGGIVSGSSQETDEFGEAFGFIWTAPAGAGDYNITISDTDPRGGIFLTHKVTVN